MTPPLLALGLMSGTSADGIDAALITTDGVTIHEFGETYFLPYPEEVKLCILKVYGHPPGPKEAELTREITALHGRAVSCLLKKAKLDPSHVDVIGFHGQTLFHKPPRAKGERGETHILSDGQFLANYTTIPVIDQFRLNDIAHGGQGAPFVPLFHQALTRNMPKPLAILNIGGVANVTWIGGEADHLIAFDTGPGNGIIDDWMRAQTGRPWDDRGQTAAQGIPHETLLTKWLSHPYFQAPAPKSLDRLTFKDCLEDLTPLSVEDGAATLTAFTAATIERALSLLPQAPQRWIVAGGGTHNETLLTMLRERLGVTLEKASDYGWNGDALEAQAFGFLAVRSLKNLPLSLPGTTGVPYPLQGGRFHHPPPKA